MIELGQLESRHEDFARRNTRVIVVSMEETKDAELTQVKCPHLLVLTDAGRGLSEAAGVVHAHAAPDGRDIDVPTTVIVDKQGTVRWLYRTPEVIARLSPDDVLDAVDRTLSQAR
jgi:alkyl hydroperoxide reductase subunit AhpC